MNDGHDDVASPQLDAMVDEGWLPGAAGAAELVRRLDNLRAAGEDWATEALIHFAIGGAQMAHPDWDTLDAAQAIARLQQRAGGER